MRALGAPAPLHNVSIQSFIRDGLRNFPGLCHPPSFSIGTVNLMLLKSGWFESFRDCREFIDQRQQQQLLTRPSL